MAFISASEPSVELGQTGQKCAWSDIIMKLKSKPNTENLDGEQRL